MTEFDPNDPSDEAQPQTSIRVQGLSKAYRVYDKKFDFLKEAISGRRWHREKLALSDINIEIASGEVVGVIGRNGAGKSTLLKVLAGTLSPTSGSVEIQGKVSAILELGTGFNAAYSGRDNVIMACMMRGLTEQQVRDKFDDIVDFAGLRDVIDHPFQTYSSGMQARLAFAAATAVEAQVLIIDEALAAGDIRFAAKSLRRIHEICASGVTALFVSHVSYTVMQLCSRVIWIDNGKVVMDGDPVDVVRAYEYEMHAEISEDQGKSGVIVAPQAPIVDETGEVDSAEPETLGQDFHDLPDDVDSSGEGNSEDSPETGDFRVEVDDLESSERSTACSPGGPIELQSEDAGNCSSGEETRDGSESSKAMETVPNQTVGEQSYFSSGEYKIRRFGFLDDNDQICVSCRFGERIRFIVEYERLSEAEAEYSCGLAVAFNRASDFEAVMYFNTNYPHSDEELKQYYRSPYRQYRGNCGRVTATIDPVQLKSGEYLVSFGILPNQPGHHEFYEYHHCKLTFVVLPNGFEEPAVFYPSVQWINEEVHSG